MPWRRLKPGSSGRPTSSGRAWIGGDLRSAPQMPTVSIVIPVLNDEAALARLLHELGAFVRGGEVEIIVADGGSVDNGPNHAREFGCVLVNSPRSRGKQLAAGVARARANWIWLLHADSTGVVEPLRWMLLLSGARERVCPAAISLPGAPRWRDVSSPLVFTNATVP